MGYQRIGAFLEGRLVLVGLPVAHHSVPIKSTSLIIESMPDLVPDNSTNTPIVDGILGGQVEEGWLQYGGGEHNFVE